MASQSLYAVHDRFGVPLGHTVAESEVDAILTMVTRMETNYPSTPGKVWKDLELRGYTVSTVVVIPDPRRSDG